MTKTERNKTINKQIYKLAESLGYEVNMDETDVIFISPDGNNDNDIQYRRSCHTIAALNWASTKTLGHEKLMDDYIDELKLMSDEELLIEHQGA
jgi:hypothetical protein